MRFTILFAVFFLTVLNFPAYAVEPVDDQQILMYYEIPLGGISKNSKKHQFGLRLDRTQNLPGEVTQLGQLVKKPALMNLQKRKNESITFKIHGVDFTNRLKAHQADENESSEAVAENGGTDEQTETDATVETPSPEDDKTVVQKTLDELPKGVIIGVAIGIVLLAGIGG